MPLRYGYISNGFADHTLEQMVEVLERHGYGGIGITLDPRHLDPFRASSARLAEVRRLLASAGLECVIETGARFLLDAHRKHWPNLLSSAAEGRQRRLDYYLRAVEIAAELRACAVSIWSGAADGGDGEAVLWDRLGAGLAPLLDRAAELGVVIGFEPEPGMFIEDMGGFGALKRRVSHAALKLTIDLGHLAITEQAPLERAIHEHARDLANVHADDARGRRHEHLPFGEGEIDFAPLLGALLATDYRGLVLVELSRHSHDAPGQAARSLAYLRAREPRA